MVEKLIMSGRNVVDFLDYRRVRSVGIAQPINSRSCRHCGALLDVGESEDECSSVGANISVSVVERPSRARAPRKF